MKYSAKERKDKAIQSVVTLLRERLPRHLVDAAVRFTQHYYEAVAPDDLLETQIEDLYGAVLAHWRLASQRKPGAPVVRVYNPVFEEHGWQSLHTVVQIVTDDMPFLVDSVTMELIRHGLAVHLIVHPVMHMRRDHRDQLLDLVHGEVERADVINEAIMHFEVDQETDPDTLKKLRADLLVVLGDVRAVVEDWPQMRVRMNEAIAAIEAQSDKSPVPADEIAEALPFLRWVDDNHFTYVGFRAFDFVEHCGQDALRLVPGSGLGIFRYTEPDHISYIHSQLRELARAPTLLILTKSTTRSTVHRPVHLDYLGIKRFNDRGEVIGEWRFQGLYSSLAYDTRPSEIPLLRHKVAKVIQRAALSPTSHAGKALQHILNTLPRDEMFQATDDELFELAKGILSIEERQKIKVFVRCDVYGRFVSVLVFAPRDRHNTDLRLRMQDILMEVFDGQGAEFNVQFTESVLARVHFIIRTDPKTQRDFDVKEIEARILEAMLSWEDRLCAELREQFGEAKGNRLVNRYAHAFPSGYRDEYTPRTAVVDIKRLETIHDHNSLSMHLYQPPESGDDTLRFKVFGRRHPMALSDVLPILERMGLRVLGARPYEIEPVGDVPYWILNFNMTPARGVDVEVLSVKNSFQEAFARVTRGEMENDGFNGLVLVAGLNWRQVTMLRAICKYLLQIGVPFSQPYMEQSLTNNPNIARLLVHLFHVRFDPQLQQDALKQSVRLTEQIEEAVDQIASLDEDRILRRFLAIILAILRTNFFQQGAQGVPKPYLSFKLDSSKVPELPLPRPMFEIFVYSTHVEAIHLRGGLVARGGLRWSDRREDFRAEVLGLMKAQMVKNAVIVPVGAKGGFIAKQLPGTGSQEDIQQEVIRCYSTFIRGLLDITDNRQGEQVLAPPEVVRYDGDDPYLVVAADKGTTHFSDIANEIATEYGFWLGDAFASGGTHGYDHKKIGITARGAWESVKRHFRELGMDTQRTTFTVVGIGDLSGDVFGNGMLRSPQIRLIGAFNHKDIFVDPDPDAQVSFQERERLFTLPRSSWSDYNPKLLSKGGSVYSRSLKSISLSPEARRALNIETERLIPNELIQAILRAPVDLLWNGGIGTYVKASSESHAAVSDRTNDTLRINTSELRCRAIGEGGNLGLTQRARIEYACNGGLIYTDAVDNSAGVNCSDHEVNVKILLNRIVASGDMTTKQRNQLLSTMTDEVAHLVLRDNYLQTQAISIEANQASYLLGDHVRLMAMLEREERLKCKLEALPSDEELAEREAAQTGLTRPEISVLLAYSKLRLYDQLLGSDITEDIYLSRELHAYFPTTLRERYATELAQHSLRLEIIATHIANDLLNRMGSTFCVRMQEETGAGAADIARAYTAGREIFKVEDLWNKIEALDNRISVQTQVEMFGETRRLLYRATRWLLQHRHQPLDIRTTIKHFIDEVGTLSGQLASLLRGEACDRLKNRTEELTTAGVPSELARWIAGLDSLFSTLDIAEVARETATAIIPVADTYFALAVALDLHWLKDRIRQLPRLNHWHRGVRALLRDELNAEQRALTAQLLQVTPTIKATDKRIEAWLVHHEHNLTRYGAVITELKTATKVDMAMLSVAVRELRNLGGIDIQELATHINHKPESGLRLAQ